MISASNGPLTRREQEVCDLLCEGLCNKAIGRRLGISDRTVEDHRGNIYQKLKVHNGIALVQKILSAEKEVLTARIAELEGARAQ